jgi:hypothetical protein
MEKKWSSTHERLNSGNQTNREKLEKLERKIKTKNTKLVNKHGENLTVSLRRRHIHRRCPCVVITHVCLLACLL